MARIQVQLDPSSEVETFDVIGQTYGRIAGFRLDGVDVYIGHAGRPAEERDAEIVSASNLLIGVLVGLRDAAMQRIREEKVAHDAAWAEELDAPLALTPDPGDHYIRETA